MSAESDFSFHLDHCLFDDLESECRNVLEKYPLFSIAGAAGKFTTNYAVWAFDIESPIPLIQKVKAVFQHNREKLNNKLGIDTRIDISLISYSPEQNNEISFLHKYGLY